MFWGLMRGLRWSAPLIRWGSVLFVGWYWIDRLLLGRTDFLLVSWPLILLISLLGLSFIFWSLNRPKVQAHTTEMVL